MAIAFIKIQIVIRLLKAAGCVLRIRLDYILLIQWHQISSFQELNLVHYRSYKQSECQKLTANHIGDECVVEEIFIAAFKCRLPPEEDEPKNDYDSYQEA